MQHGDNQPSFEWFRHADGNGAHMPSKGCSIRPGTAVPCSVLVSNMGDGSLLLEGWWDGPSAHLSPADAVPFKRQLAAAFGSPHLTPSGSRNRAQ